jgi:hypothetical protein
MPEPFQPINWPRLPVLHLFLAGPAASGKAAVARHLADHHRFHRTALSDFCRHECERLGWPTDRRRRQQAGDRLRGTDAATLARLALEVHTPDRVLGVVVDGVRLPEEAQALRWAGFLGVGVSASDWTRSRRLRARGEPWPPHPHPTEWEARDVQIDLPRLEQPVQVWLHGQFVCLAHPYVAPEQVPRQPPAAPQPQGPGLSALDIFDRQRRERLQQTLEQALPPTPQGLPFTEAAAAALLERLLQRGLDEQERRWLAETWRRCGGLDPQRCAQALGSFIARHGTAQHLVYYLDQIEAAHLKEGRT